MLRSPHPGPKACYGKQQKSSNIRMQIPLHQQTLSLDHAAFSKILSKTRNLLVIQDLDGVCMELVNDPLDRIIDLNYLQATQIFAQHFYVLTNGEHIGKRGVNRIVDRLYHSIQSQENPAPKPSYLPGLAAGGVQWQERDGEVCHPGVSDAELNFLAAVPDRIRMWIHKFFRDRPQPPNLEPAIEASVLDNIASPTANLNTFYQILEGDTKTYIALQQSIQQLMNSLLADAKQQGLADSFFVHYAPNLGKDEQGQEVLWFSQLGESGTTDFQFMLRGAIKEAGVLALLNRYYRTHFGTYPLGECFNVRQAPHSVEVLAQLAQTHFDPALMPCIIGVGDTVTSQTQVLEEQTVIRRGGSDRNFLQLIQTLGQTFNTENLVVYVDSSGGELKNRKPLKLETRKGSPVVIEGPGDRDDPLQINVAFPGGHHEYCQCFQRAASLRQTEL